MTKDDIIRMAREAGFADGAVEIIGFDGFATFAALIKQHLSYDGIHTCHDECQRPACVAMREAIKAEREVCAEMVERMNVQHPKYIAAAIRARGEK